jgi:hypothetical protein
VNIIQLDLSERAIFLDTSETVQAEKIKWTVLAASKGKLQTCLTYFEHSYVGCLAGSMAKLLRTVRIQNNGATQDPKSRDEYNTESTEQFLSKSTCFSLNTVPNRREEQRIVKSSLQQHSLVIKEAAFYIIGAIES